MNHTSEQINDTAAGGKYRKRFFRRLSFLVLYDMLVLAVVLFVMLWIYPGVGGRVTGFPFLLQFLVFFSCLMTGRYFLKTYSQIWRYSINSSYLRIIIADSLAAAAYLLIRPLLALLPGCSMISLARVLSIFGIEMLGCISLRLAYSWVYEHSMQLAMLARQNPAAHFAVTVLSHLSMLDLLNEDTENILSGTNRIKIAIVGAGRIGVGLAEDLISNHKAVYIPVCFIDSNQDKTGRSIAGIPVIAETSTHKTILDKLGVQEVVFAVRKDEEEQKKLFDRYSNMGYKVKAYTLPVGNSSANGKRQIREFEPEELLFRQQTDYLSGKTRAYYKDKVVMVTGGGGSIGSELARQIAKMKPRQLIVVDIYENNAYDLQQELKLTYGEELNLAVEIASVRDAQQIDKVIGAYKPQIILHAAAHKHVPLMEHNCSEAVKNNVFGTLNVVTMAEKHGVEKFVMISTDKAVNPTNVMGASKRMCEMIVLSHAGNSKTSFSCTRFGNVLGSNGSVIPLFKRQIANGGPVTLTDRRIIRYFMTIPEASQLVLNSGAIAKNGELFVLDMGRPVKILDLAESMIRLSGLEPYKDIDIVETGLRPGEKLFEELLIKTETLKKTDNNMIFIEKDEPLSPREIEEKLAVLREALETEDDDVIRLAMKKVVPTFHSAKHVNRDALSDGRYQQEAVGHGQNIAG